MQRYNQETKQESFQLRKKGYSIMAISKELGIAKSTASLWVRNVKLDTEAITTLSKNQKIGRQKGINSRQLRLSRAYNSIQNIVTNDLSNKDLDILTKRLLCSFLYWCEGSKARSELRITNSDPKLITVFLRLFRESFYLDESKFAATLHLHEYHDKNERLLFWSNLTKIPKNRIGIYNKPNTGKRKKKDYPGCIAIHYYDVKMYDILTAYYTKFYENMGA